MDQVAKTSDLSFDRGLEAESTVNSLIHKIKFSSYKEKFTALKSMSKLIKNNAFPEYQSREVFDLLLSNFSSRNDMIGGLSRYLVVRLLDIITVLQKEINQIVDLLLLNLDLYPKDSVDQGSGSLKLIIRLTELKVIPENRKNEIFKCLTIKFSSTNIKISKSAAEGIRLLSEMRHHKEAFDSSSDSDTSHFAINLPTDKAVNFVNSGLSELDSLISEVNVIKGKRDIKQIWKKIEKLIKNQSISDEKAEEFLSFLETKAMGNPGRTAKKSLKVLETLLSKYDISLASSNNLLKLIQKQFYKENVSKEKLVKIINILARKHLISETLQNEILELLTSNLSTASKKLSKCMTDCISSITRFSSLELYQETELAARELKILDHTKKIDSSRYDLTHEFSRDISQKPSVLRMTENIENDDILDSSDSEVIISASSSEIIKSIKIRSDEIAKLVLERGKILLKANMLPSNELYLEEEFIVELAMLLRVKHTHLLNLSERNEDLKLNLIKKLASELKKEGKFYIKDEKFTLNEEELLEDSEIFFNPAILSVKEQLKTHTYLDEMAHQRAETLEIRYVKEIVYENLLLNYPSIIQEVRCLYGSETLNALIDMNKDNKFSSIFIESVNQYGIDFAYKSIIEPLCNDLVLLPTLFDKVPKIDISEQTKASSSEVGRILAITEETNRQPNRNYNNHKSEYSFKPNDNLALTAFTSKEVIEALPIIKYFVKEILQVSYELPEIFNNNYFKLTAHFVATNIGAYSLIGKFSIVSSLLPTAVYGGKVLAYEYLSQQKHLNFQVQENKSIDSLLEFTQKCGFDIAAQTALGIVSSFISGNPFIYDIMISATTGGMQCYSQYNHKGNLDSSNIISTGEKIIPYFADTITYYVAINNMEFDLSSTSGQMLAIKQGFTVLSSVVMTDYVTKLAISSMPEGYFECQNDNIIGKTCNYFGWECSNQE